MAKKYRKKKYRKKKSKAELKWAVKKMLKNVKKIRPRKRKKKVLKLKKVLPLYF